MTPQAQRIAIAEACPKVFYLARTSGIFWRNGFLGGTTEAGKFGGAVDVLTDLNAIAEAENSRFGKNGYSSEWGEWETQLTVVIRRDNDTHGAYLSDMCRASAAQRAEAFLRTLHLWDDTK